MVKHIGDFYLDKDVERRLEDPATSRPTYTAMFAEPAQAPSPAVADYVCKRCGSRRGTLTLDRDASGKKLVRVAKCANCGHEQEPAAGVDQVIKPEESR